MNALYKYKRTMPSAPAMNQTDTGIGFGSASLSRLFICLFMLRYEGGRSPRLPGAICTLCTLYSGESDTPYAAAFSIDRRPDGDGMTVLVEAQAVGKLRCALSASAREIGGWLAPNDEAYTFRNGA